MNARTTGLGGMIVFVVAGGAILVALFPIGMQHRIRHAWREKECVERLTTLHKLAEIRSSMFGRRRTPQYAGTGHWLAIQNTAVPLIDPSNLDLFFCPFQASEIAPGATDFRGPRDRGGPAGDYHPVGADLETNHPPCCPLNVVLKEGSVKSCPYGDPWKLQLRSELRP